MIFNVEAFTHRGVLREMNQDRILVRDKVFNDCNFSETMHYPARFFVADGVGGHPSGEVAAGFVLDALNRQLAVGSFPTRNEVMKLCSEINRQLLNYCIENPEYSGSATTLAGIIFSETGFMVINAGDSRVLLLRDDKLTQLTSDQVLMPEIANSPITSYFGGTNNALKVSISTGNDEAEPKDIFMVSTDGVFKVMSNQQIEKILANSKPLHEKAEFIFFKAIQNGAPDNISCIFIELQKSSQA